MSRYGAKITADGKEVRANGSMPKLTGERVIGNVIEYFGMSTDINDNPVTNFAEIRFRQSNGALFVHKFRDSELDWMVDNLNKSMLHICTKIVTEAEYYVALEGTTNFSQFIEAVKTKIIPKALNMTFTCKITLRENTNVESPSYGQWFTQFPQFPNFIEVDKTIPSTLTTNPKYDIYIIPEATIVKEDSVNDTTEEEIF